MSASLAVNSPQLVLKSHVHCTCRICNIQYYFACVNSITSPVYMCVASFPGLPRYVRVLISGGGNNAVKTRQAWAE